MTDQYICLVIRNQVKAGLLILFFLISEWAIAGDFKSTYVSSEKNKVYSERGFFVGGQSRGNSEKGYSLLNLRKHYSPKSRMERLVLDFGNAEGGPLHGELLFFQVAVDGGALSKAQGSVSIDMQEVVRSGLDQSELSRIMSSSRFVSKATMTYDPQDQSMNLFFQMKSRRFKVEVFKIASTSRSGRLIIDIKEGL